MAIDHRMGNKVQRNLRREEAPATRVDPHPYIGIVKNNLDPTRCGRMQVWIPELGGDPDDPKNWRTVSYSSPYMGTTDISKTASPVNKFGNTPHTYGMWMVPPDVGVEVIVLFIGGDPMRGYWIGCVNSNISRYMLPGIAASGNISLSGASKDITETLTVEGIAPVAEFNPNDPELAQKPAFYTNAKPVHEPQYRILREQGLDRDTTRGLISSSSQRESPSQVFGISTPGRPWPDNGADNPEAFMDKVNKGTLTEADYAYTTRSGGHTFIMDDGALTGKDQLVRLRSAKGHQIMMHDAESTLYIAHADGTSWVELTADGAINVFSETGFNLRTQGSLNLHADNDININAVQDITMNAGGKIHLESGGTTNLLSGKLAISTNQLEVSSTKFSVSTATVTFDATSRYVVVSPDIQENGVADTITPPAGVIFNSLGDVTKSSGGLYVSTPGKLRSVVTVAPTHEPFDRGEAVSAAIAATKTPAGIKPRDAVGPREGFTTAKGAANNPAPESALRAQPKCNCTVGPLGPSEMTAFMAQAAWTESGGPVAYNKNKFSSEYEVTNQYNFLGKYQIGWQALSDLGYISKACTSNAKLKNPSSWTPKKNGIGSYEEFLANGAEQEAAMCALVKLNYGRLCNNGGITSDMTPEQVAGVLMVSHLLGAGGAHKWSVSGSGKDANGMTGDKYFQNGKYAIAHLAPMMSAVDKS